MIREWNPDFIINNGDNDYSDGAFEGTLREQTCHVGAGTLYRSTQ